MILEWIEMALATIGIGGVAALWLVKALLGLTVLRAWRRWRLRSRARGVLVAPPAREL